MRSFRRLVASSCTASAFAWGALGMASAEGNASATAGIGSPAACSQRGYASAPIPPGVERSSVPPNPGGPTIVGMAFFVTKLREIDALRNDYAFQGYVRSTWCDPRLAFDPAEAGTDERSSFGAAAEQEMQSIWFPAGFPVDEVGSIEVLDRVLSVGHDGTVQSNVNISVRIAANFDLRRFPFDRQRLELAVESFLWPEDDLVLAAEPEATDFAHDFSMPEWRIERVDTRIESARALRSAKPFSRLVLEIDVARKSGFYLWKILLPLVVIVALSWSIFWMSGEAAVNRVRLSATGVLTIVAYQFVVGAGLPRIAYLTLLDKVMILSFVLLAVTVVPSLLVSHYWDDDKPRARRIDRFSRVLFPGTYLVLLLLVVATSGR
jgi:hypothetical protein